MKSFHYFYVGFLNNMTICLTKLNGVVSYQEETFGVQPTTQQISKAKLVGLKEFFNTFDISELVYEEADETTENVNSDSESW